jgi:type I restriction enzyme S subunit
MTEIVRLGDLCHTTSGGTPSRSRPEFFGGEIPWVKSGNLNDGLVYEIDESISAEGLASSSAKIFPAGTLLIAMYGATVGRLGILGREAATNQAVCGIQPNNDIDRDFLFHCLLHKRKELVGKSVGGAQPNISQAIIRDTLVPLPPLDEQRRIVGLLDRAAEIRRRADAARAKARAIIPALFLDTFGDPATNPKGWPTAELGRHADVQGGVQVSAKRAALPVELPYLRVANVMRGRLDLTEIKMIRVTASEALRTNLVPGDVLVVEGHGNPNEIGRAAVWDGSITTCTHQNHLIRVRPGLGSLTPEYVETFLNSDVGRRILIHNGKTTSGLNTISTRNVKEVRIPLPPTGLQSVFAEQIQRIEALARHLDAAAAKAEAMAAGLSAEVFG